MIATLAPGEIAVAECSFQAPLVGELMTVDAIVDGGGVIDERNDSNNERETTVTLTLPEETEAEDVESGVSTTTIYIGSLIALVLIVVAFTMFAPAKIKTYPVEKNYGMSTTPDADEQSNETQKVE